MTILSKRNTQTMPVYVAGTGVTSFGELWEESLESLAIKAVEQALSEAGTTINEVDSLVVGNMLIGQLEGRAHLGRIVGDAIGFVGTCMAVEGACASGGLAVRTGVMALRSGMARRVLVVGVEKMTDIDSAIITRALMSAGSEDEQIAGATFPALYAMMQRAYQARYGLGKKDMACMPVLAHRHGVLNPLAQFRKEITEKQVVESALVADPIRQLDCAPISDGAAAVVLSVDLSLHNKANSVVIAGSGQGWDSLSLAGRSTLISIGATKHAVASALAEAEMTISDIEVMEVHDCFSVAGLMALEDLGVCEVGMGPRFVKESRAFVINPSGGLKACGHPVGATGVKQVVEITRQLQGRVGKRQAKQVKVGLTHNVGGTGATAVVHILKQLGGNDVV